MLRLESSFDEGELGFGKFSRFLRQAHDHEVIDLQKREDGTYQVSARAAAAPDEGTQAEKPAEEPKKDASRENRRDRGRAGKKDEDEKPAQMEIGGEVSDAIRGVGVRRGMGRPRKGKDGPPPFLEGQVVAGAGGTRSPMVAPTPDESAAESVESEKKASGRTPRSRKGKGGPKTKVTPSTGIVAVDPSLDLGTLGLPTGGPALVRYLTNSYRGVGRKTAETVVNEFGSELFQVLHTEPGRLDPILPAARVEQLLEGWKVDLARRTGPAPTQDPPREGPKAQAGAKPDSGAEEVRTETKAPNRRRTRGGGSSRGRSRKKKAEGDSE
jgi:hypothetical protein